MAGLLKQLQRSRPRTGESQPVVVTAEDAVVDVIPATAAVRGTEQIDRRYVEAEKLLGDLMKESKGTPDGAVPATPPTEAGSKALHIIRRSAESASGAAVKQVASQTGAPSWSREERKLPEHTERFLLDACRALIEKVSQKIPPRNELPQFVQTMVEELASQRVGDVRLSWKDNDMVLREIAALYLTRGPMTPLFEDNDVTEIFVDHYKSIKVIRKGQLIDTPFQFSSSEEYRLSVMFLLDEAGWQLSSSKPIVECVLADKWQSRVSVLDGSLMGAAEPRLTIRIPRSMKTSFYEILQRKVLPATLAAWLAEVVARGEANILIVGQSGSGKTLVTSALLSEIGSEERVTTIEDIPELAAAGANVEKLVARGPDSSGNGGITKGELIELALRRTSRRIVVSELDGGEAGALLRALESGASGCIASIYGDFPEDGLWRLLDQIASYEQTPQETLMRRISRSVHLVIALEKIDGKPCLTEVVEVYPLRGSDFSIQPIVRFEGVTGGKRMWRMATADSYWMRKTAQNGVTLRSGPGLLQYEKEK